MFVSRLSGRLSQGTSQEILFSIDPKHEVSHVSLWKISRENQICVTLFAQDYLELNAQLCFVFKDLVVFNDLVLQMSLFSG